jgi:hypothetical protein
MPTAAQRCASLTGDTRDLGFQRRSVVLCDQRRSCASDAGLLERDAHHGIGGHALFRDQQERLVVDAQRGDAAGCGLDHDVGRVKTSAQANLDNAGVCGMARESEEGCGGCDLEETRPKVFTQIENFLQQRGQFLIGDQLARQPDAFIVAHQMRFDRRMDREPLRLKDCAQVRAGRSLAVRPGNVKHGRQVLVRIAQSGEQRVNHLQP